LTNIKCNHILNIDTRVSINKSSPTEKEEVIFIQSDLNTHQSQDIDANLEKTEKIIAKLIEFNTPLKSIERV